jgi:chaperonin GroEL (HSP60 family)
VATYISDVVKPCLGPRGMYKLVSDKFGETAFTNDGAVILEKMELHHPVAKVLRETAKTVETIIGDGTKTTIILIGELLKRAERLISHKVKVGKIIEGYLIAYNVALQRLREISIPIDRLDNSVLKKLILTLFSSRNLDEANFLADLLTEALSYTLKKIDGRNVLDKESIRIVKKVGKDLRESRVIRGAVIDKNIVHLSMPRIIRDAKIAVLNMALKIDEFRHLQPYKYEINIRDPLHLEQFLEEEEGIIRDMVNKIISVGANVVICRKKIGRTASQLLAEAGIIGIGRLLKEEDFNAVARLTGANIVSDLNDLKEEDLGRASIVREEKFGDKSAVIIEGCNNFEGVTLLLRAGLEDLLNEVEHAINDAIRYIVSLLEEPAYTPAGGAVEEALAIAIRNESTKYSGKEQVAMHAFANALESIPKLLISNAGYNPADILPELRSKHLNGEYCYGIDPHTGKVVDMIRNNAIESYKAKEQVLKTSFETATLLLRVDEVVDRRYAKRHEGELGGQ